MNQHRRRPQKQLRPLARSDRIRKKSGVQRRLGEDLYHRLLSTTWPRFVLFLAFAYWVINFFFGCIYFIAGREGLTGLHSQSALQFFEECFFFSIQTFSTIGYGHISPIGLFDNTVVAVQALLGLISIGLMSGLFFSRFSRPTARVQFSEVALLTRHMGKKTLMFRMANARFNQIIEATVSVTLIMDTVTAEGSKWRQMQDLTLVRQRTALLTLSWTVLHVVDEKSPLYSLTLDDLRMKNAQIWVHFIGYDETFSQNIHARQSFTPDQLVFDRHFVDILHQDDDKDIFIDLARISELQPAPSL